MSCSYLQAVQRSGDDGPPDRVAGETNEDRRHSRIEAMSGKGEKVLEEALTLPPEERADLAAILIESLDEREDDAVEEAWAREIQQRMRESESGAVRAIPWPEARKRILALRDARTKP